MKKLIILGAVILVMGIIFLGWWNSSMGPVDKKDTSSKIFVVKKGVGIRELGNNLKKENLIKDPVVFFLYIKKEGLDKDIQAGAFRLSPSMDIKTLVQQLQTGSLDKWVTIREGLRAEEIAEILKSTFPGYKDSWLAALQAEEGYLFPDTYLIPTEASIETIIGILRSTFEKKITEIGLSPESANIAHVVTMASLIEREANADDEKPQIASVMYNRLDIDMPLQIDATVQYAIGKRPNSSKWWNEPSADDLKVDSAYNTYINIGLPPGPISNPGIASIKAAAFPADTEYFYYIHDKQGIVHFAKTGTEHNANVNKYLR